MRNEDMEYEEELDERLERQRQLREERWIYRDEQSEKMREVGHRWSDF